MDTVEFVKGHGTENDFVVLPDPAAELDLSPGLVAALCDRRSGIGADGVLRVVPTGAVDEVSEQAAVAGWFMDYRNADGSVAEMCGNGVRVFARYLVTAGLAEPGRFLVATRGGPKAVTVRGPSDDVAVDMGPPQLLDLPSARVVVGDRRYSGVAISMGNPHLAVPVADLDEAGELRSAPLVEPADAFPEGVNVEFVLGRGPGQIAMRVHERGVGETRSCGTGACAAAVAAATWWDGGDLRDLRYSVDVPGGRLQVRGLPDGHLELSGPAVLVAHGSLDRDWLARYAGGAAAHVA